MSILTTVLRSIGRFVVNVLIPILALLGKALLFISRRFGSWWLATFRARSGRGKLLFGLATLVATVLLYNLTQAILSPAAAPPSVVVELDDGLPPAGSTEGAVAGGDAADMAATQRTWRRRSGHGGDAADMAAQGLVAELPPGQEPAAQASPTATLAPTSTATIAPTNTARLTATAAATGTARPAPTQAPATGAVIAAVPAGDEAVVTRIIDGDTIDVMMNGEIFRVRYIGMDTPERGMPFFAEAMEANRQLVEGQTVILVRDVSETDRYGRLLRYVYLTSGLFVNAELVRLGFAQIATYPPDVAHQADFLALQLEARESALGLWALPVVAAAVEASPEPTQPLAPLPTDTPPPAPAPAAVVISRLYYDGLVSRVESDEYAEITNNGGSPVNLAGWRLNAGAPNQDLWFPSFDLQPGQSCRVYTNQIHGEHCGFSFGSGQALWNNSGDCGYLYDASGAEVSRRCY